MMHLFKSTVKISARSRGLLRGATTLGSTRLLNVLEYVSMDLMRDFGIPVPKSGVATSVEEANKIYTDMIGDGASCVIKEIDVVEDRDYTSSLREDIVNLCTGPKEVGELASKMMGENHITTVMLAERIYLRREMYFSIMLDLATGETTIVASPAGGTSIEEVADVTPEQIFQQAIDIKVGITDGNSTFLATSLGFIPGSQGHRECKSVVEKLYKMFHDHGCTLMEVNPLAETHDDRVVVCDCQMGFNADTEFHKKGVFVFRDRSREDWSSFSNYSSEKCMPGLPAHRTLSSLRFFDPQKGLPVGRVDFTATMQPGKGLMVHHIVCGDHMGASAYVCSPAVPSHTTHAAARMLHQSGVLHCQVK